MALYHRVLGGALDMQAGESVRHAQLEIDGAVIIATDGHPDYPAKVGENVCLSLSGTDRDRLTRIFNELAEGGRVQMPLAKQPWGTEVGWLADRFGILWTVNIATGQ
jgi:PhnB protein